MTYTGEDGTPDFGKLQAYDGKGPLRYYAFDILWKDGYNLQELELLTRKDILRSTLPESKVIEYTTSFE